MIPMLIHTEEFESEAARFILEEGRGAIAERRFFRLGLSGGNTPRAVHETLAELAGDFPWDKVQITFGDERCVPPEHPDSNYRMARQSLLDRVPIPSAHVFRIRGEADPEMAAREYEARLAALAAHCRETSYRHDLLILGLGEDGHTASLFPGSPALEENVRQVIPAIGPKPPPQRITMTLPLINASRHVLFLVNDPAKKPILDDILVGDSVYPAARVDPADGLVTWMLGN